MEASRAAARPRSRKSLRQLVPLRHTRAADPAFEQLYRTHSREVYQYALALLTNPADAEDATQTTFLNAYRAFQRGERPQKPHNWLITITHNVCRMRWRQAGSRPREVALDEAPEPVALDHERPNLDGVLAALAQLSFNQRAALVMRELEGRSYQEIAGVLGVSSSAVEALLFRARRRLKLERDALGVLSTAPLPGSLTTFFGGGGAVAVGGGAVLKAAAVVVAGALTAGAGYQSVQAITGSGAPAAKVRPASPKQHRAASAGRAQPLRKGGLMRRETRRRGAPATRAGSVSPAGPSNAPQPSAGPALPLPLVSTLPLVSSVPLVSTVPVPPVTVPKIVPPPPVHVTPPPLPPPPITLTTPTLPPPPIK